MKRGGLLLLILAGIAAFFYFGGSADGPDNVPNPQAPSPDEAAGGIAGFFDSFGDWISQRGDVFWRVVIVFALVGLGVWVFKKVPMVVWLVLAVFGIIVAVQL